MRIDEALGEIKPLAVKFGTAVLNVEYRIPSYTIEQMVLADSDKANPERLIPLIQDLVHGWDLTRIAKVAVPASEENDFIESVREVEVPVDVTNPDDIRRFVPSPIIMGIVNAIRKDQEVSGE